jgi:predicted naringenin-chalcone synthase
MAGRTRRTFHQKSKKYLKAAVDKRYPSWILLKFYKTSFEERNDIYVREVIDLGEKVLERR